jgi:hypothetical protein
MNDLIGLQYAWGHRPLDGSGFTDCFQLSCEVRKRMGLIDHSSLYSWVYEQYDENTFTPRRLARFLFQSGIRTSVATIGNMVLVDGPTGALGTVTEYGIIYIGAGRQVIHRPGLLLTTSYFDMDQS